MVEMADQHTPNGIAFLKTVQWGSITERLLWLHVADCTRAAADWGSPGG